MKITFNCSGNRRKELVNAISEFLGVEPKYKGAPTFAYKIGDFEVDRDGTLNFNDGTEGESLATLLAFLESRGFTPGGLEEATQGKTKGTNLLVIEVPKEGFTDRAFANLEKLIESKGDLIKKALEVNELPIDVTNETVRFPWFHFDEDAEKVKAYTHFITAICEMVKTQKRINTTARAVENEKYAFRCFLLRLGFIGPEYKTERKILLSKLTGSSAFKYNPFKTKEEKQ